MYKKIFVALSLSILAASASFAKSTEKFMMISDIHFNPFYACQSNPTSTCTIAEKLNAATPAQWPSILKQYGSKQPSAYGSDTNYTLLTNALNNAKELNDSQFVITGGDFLGHNLQTMYQAYTKDTNLHDYQGFVKKEFVFLRNELSAAFPGKTIIPTLGNNDSYNGDYFVTPNGSFFSDMTNIFKSWFQSSQNYANFSQGFSGKNSGSTGGYYAINYNKHIKFIDVDSGYFSAKRQEPTGVNAAAMAQTELTWLQKQLNLAKTNGQNVWLIMHIPPGINAYNAAKGSTNLLFWDESDNAAFLKIVKAFKNIKMLFVFHTHNDAFRVITTKGMNFIPEVFSPSVSPIHYNNPAFKVYQFNPQNGRVTNAAVFRENNNASWGLEYVFNTSYNTNNLYNGIKKLILQKQLLINPTYLKNYATYYTAGAKTPINSSSIKYYFCADTTQTINGYHTCISNPLDHIA